MEFPRQATEPATRWKLILEGDFNGDGILSLADPSDVPLRTGSRELTDLEVLFELWKNRSDEEKEPTSRHLRQPLI